jgi:translation initiation factor IF-3
VRCIDARGEQIGILPTQEALKMAMNEGLDLVEVSPQARPPVCRIMDYGKYRYEQGKKTRQARKHGSAGKVKEIKFHANVDQHDYDTKMRHARDFLESGNKVKCSLFFRGREGAHKEIGFELMTRVMKDLEDVSKPEQKPTPVGRAIYMMLSPLKKV